YNKHKGIQLQSTCNLCRESHKPQVWLCVLVENCDNEMLRCYILELMMAINEAELQAEVEAEVFGTKERCIFDYFHLYYFSETLHNSVSPGDCRPCEAYSLQNITIFLERLNNLLEKMSSQGTT
uniref:Interleukin n=1 Tax=Monopterus albus TaxID=43700 RepID=A0A3Q3IPY6_MONAL